MKLPAKWKDRLILVGALMWIGFMLQIVMVVGGVVVDVIVGIINGADFTRSLTKRLLAPWW